MNRAERRSKKQAIINKRLKEIKQIDRFRHSYLSIRSNFLSKQDAFDCGQTCCLLCSGEKLFGDKDNKGYKKTQSNTYKKDITDE